MVKWKLLFTRQAQKDARKLAAAGLKENAQGLLDLLAEDPFRATPPFVELRGDLAGASSRRIDIRRRLVYQVLKGTRTVKVLRMWTAEE